MQSNGKKNWAKYLNRHFIKDHQRFPGRGMEITHR